MKIIVSNLAPFEDFTLRLNGITYIGGRSKGVTGHLFETLDLLEDKPRTRKASIEELTEGMTRDLSARLEFEMEVASISRFRYDFSDGTIKDLGVNTDVRKARFTEVNPLYGMRNGVKATDVPNKGFDILKTEEYAEELHAIKRFFKEGSTYGCIGMYVKLMDCVASGFAEHGDVVAISCPETLMHPEEQVKFARFLVSFKLSTGVNLLLQTNSPYFLRAMETFAESESIGHLQDFYKVERLDTGLVSIKNCFSETLYDDFAKSLAWLESFKMDRVL